MVRRSVLLLSAALILVLLPGLSFPSTTFGSGSAWASSPPTYVRLQSSVETLPLGSSFDLSASWDNDLAGTGDVVSIWDMTLAAELAVCSSGTTCSATAVSFVDFAVHRFAAYVAPSGGATSRTDPVVVSGVVDVTPAPWSVSLAATPSVVSEGTSVTVTATANQNLSAAAGAVALVIVDGDGEEVQRCTTSTTCVYSTTAPAAGVPGPFMAQVEWVATASSMASSNLVTLSDAPYLVTLLGALATDTTLTAELNQAVESGYSWRIWDETTSTAYACSSSPCTVTVPGVSGDTFVAQVREGSTVVTSSNEFTAGSGLFSVSLSTDAFELGAGETATLTATANATPTGSLRLLVVDTWSNKIVKNCGLVVTCQYTDAAIYDATYWKYHVGEDRRFVAYVATVGSGSTVGTDVRATSNPVNLQPRPWAVQLEQDRRLFPSGESSTMTLTELSGQDVGDTANQLRLVLYDETQGHTVGSCTTSTSSCVIPVAGYDRYVWGGRHEYRAYVGLSGTTRGTMSSDPPTNQVAVSNLVWTARSPWTITWDGSTARVNQDLASAWHQQNPSFPFYKIHILPVSKWPMKSSTDAVASCLPAVGVQSCTFDLSAAPYPGPYVAVVASNTWDANKYLQATSRGFSASTAEGVLNPAATVGGAGACVQAAAADPCSPATGEFYENYTDLALPGRLAMSLTRSYSSARAASTGLFGAGWSSTFDTHLVRPPVPSTGAVPPVQVIMGNGSTFFFDQFRGSNLFTPREGVRQQLRLNSATGSYEMRDAVDGTVVAFDASGALSSIQDRIGTSNTFTRTSSTLVGTSSDGRTITVSLNPDGTAASAVGPSGRTYTYSYDGQGNLTTVVDARGKTWRYGYSTPSNHRLTSVQSPTQYTAGTSVTNTYDSSGRIKTQTMPLNPVSGGATPQSGTTTFTYSGSYPDITTTVVDPDGVRTDYAYSAGRLVSKTVDKLGTPAFATYAYDWDGNRTQTVDPDGVTISASFDPLGLKLSETDGVGNTVRWTYNSLHLPVAETITDAAGAHTTTTTYNTNGTPASVTVPLNATDTAVTEYTYGDSTHPGDLTQLTSPTGVTDFTYDARGFLTSQESTSTTPAMTIGHAWTHDPYGNVLTHTLPRGYCTDSPTNPDACDPDAVESLTYVPGSNLLSTITQPSNGSGTGGPRLVHSLDYDDDGHLIADTAASGQTWTTTYWLNGLLRSRATPLGGQTNYDYTAAARLKTVTTKIDSTTSAVVTTTYNTLGQVKTVINAEGNKAGQTGAGKTARTQTLTHSLAGRLTKSSTPDPTGGVIASQTSYDAAGRVASTTDPLGRTTTLTYGPVGLLAAITDSAGATTSYSYDYAGRLTETIAPSNGTGQPTTKYTYDTAGRVLTESAKSGTSSWLTTAYSYTPLGQLASRTTPNGTATVTAGDYTTRYEYSTSGSLTQVTDPLGHATDYTHYLDGSDHTITDPAGRVTTRAYDPDGHLTAVTVPASTSGTATTRYHYDNDARLASVEPPASSSGSITWENGYDLASRLTSQTDPLGRDRLYAYDLNHDLVSVQTARGGSTGTITYTRDPLGRLTTATYGDGAPTVTRTYAKDGQYATVTDAQGTHTYGYDTAGRVSSLTRTGAAWAWTYYPDGQLNTATRPGTGQTETYTYDLAGRRTTTATADGTLTFGYDHDSQHTSTTTPNGVTQEISYDQAGAVSGLDTVAGATTLVSRTIERNDDGTPAQQTLNRGGTTSYQSYLYDNTGRIQGTCDATLANCSAPADAEQWWTYDLNGNRTSEKNGTGSGTTTTWTYNNADQPVTRTIGAASPTSYTVDNDGNVTADANSTFTYDLNNHLTSTTTTGTTHTYTLDANGNRVADTAGTTVNYEWNPLSTRPELATITSTSQSDYRYDPSGIPILVNDNGTNASLTHDASGSITETVNDSGAIGRAYTHTPFGSPAITNPGAPNTPTGPAPAHGFHGLLAAGPSNYYTPGRLYDTSDGAFRGNDPLFMSGGPAWTSPYTYANNNPLTYTDPSGASPWDFLQGAQQALLDKVKQPWLAVGAFAQDPSGFIKSQQEAIDEMGAFDYWNSQLNPIVSVYGSVDAILNACDDYSRAYFGTNATIGLAETATIAIPVGVGLSAAGRSLTAAGRSLRAAETVTTSERVSAPLWTSTKTDSSAANALRHFNDHGSDFPGLNNSLEYVADAQGFLRSPPAGTLTRIRTNGDVVRYNPESNTFGVMDSSGAPRTYFKPDPAAHGYSSNLDYFNAQ